MRGEDERGQFRKTLGWETPPRAWGGQTCSNKPATTCGNTPTCVGRTAVVEAAEGLLQKHPHVRGEDTTWRTKAAATTETPPRAWGGPSSQIPTRAPSGNTPTCVGRTQAIFFDHEAAEKHPHVRGEDQSCDSGIGLDAETPPRAWGGPAAPTMESTRLRNTPTCVGRTIQRSSVNVAPGKHPHVRGEDHQVRSWRCRGAETPPRAWGGRLELLHQAVERGNTPTCVGRTTGRIRANRGPGKHPHVRGEDTNIWCVGDRPNTTGSV